MTFSAKTHIENAVEHLKQMCGQRAFALHNSSMLKFLHLELDDSLLHCAEDLQVWTDA